MLVIDSRTEGKQNDLEYWLKTVTSMVGDVPIIIVMNKIDEKIHPFEINEVLLKLKYPGIINFVKTSCKTFDGISYLEKAIKHAVLSLEFMKLSIPATWYSIKTRLESFSEDYISYEMYVAICIDNNVSDNHEQNLISDFLHDLGVIIHFKSLKLYQTQVLNPFWITEAIYRIINSKEVLESKMV